MDCDDGSLYASTSRVMFSKKKVEDVMSSAKRLSTKFPLQDILGIFTFLVLLPIGFIYTILLPLSNFFQLYSRDWFLCTLPLIYLGVNTYLNAWKMVKTGPNSSDGLVLPSIQKPGFHFCHQCQLNAPPRSFHCPVCNFCVLRRDHHCSFTGCCVGHFNQRFFLCAVVNLLPVSATCFIINLFMMLLSFPHIALPNVIYVMFPHLALIFGFISIYQFFMVAAFAMSAIVFVFNSYLVAAQIFCLSKGHTRIEYLMDIHAYNLGFWANLQQGLGKYWPLAFLSPFINLQLQSDGLSFRTRDMESIEKTTKYF